MKLKLLIVDNDRRTDIEIILLAVGLDILIKVELTEKKIKFYNNKIDIIKAIKKIHTLKNI